MEHPFLNWNMFALVSRCVVVAQLALQGIQQGTYVTAIARDVG